MIPKIIHQIWVGELAPPLQWMKTWREKHPTWEHILWDNEKVRSYKFKNKKHIDHYWQEKTWHGVADLIRYEALYTFGGFVAEADSVALRPIDELFSDPAFDAYTVYENEVVRPGLVSPLLACTLQNPFAKELVDALHEKKEIKDKPWKETGNLFMQQMITKTHYPRLKIFPSYYFNPEHYTGERYQGDGPVYAEQLWGTTYNSYADEADIYLLRPRVRLLAQQLKRACKKAEIPITIARGLRTKEEQDELYTQGRTTPGEIVTRRKGGDSLHNYGVAFDIRPIVKKEELYKKVGALGKELGLEWGGDWEEFVDMPHFQYTAGYSIKDFQNNTVDWSKFN